MNTDPRVAIPTPAESERIVRVICDAVDLPFRETWTLAEAAELLRAADFDVVPGTLLRFIDRGYISAPRTGQWSVINIHCAVAACESRRRWLPAPSRHDAKKSLARMQVEMACVEGVEVFHDLHAFSLEDLLIQLTTCPHSQTREIVYEAIRAKLDALGFVEE